jgi:hypothetical protein
MLGSDGNRPATSHSDLVDLIDHHHLVTRRGDGNHRVAIVHCRERPMPEFTAEAALTVSVGDLFELEGAFQSNRVGQPVAKVVWNAMQQTRYALNTRIVLAVRGPRPAECA